MSNQNVNLNATEDSTPESRQRMMQLLHEMIALHVSDVDCKKCGENLDCLADQVAQGADPKTALPGIYAHLRCCPKCHEEFTALVAVLKAQQCGDC